MLKSGFFRTFLEVNGGMSSKQFIMLLNRKRCLHESQRKTFVNPRRAEAVVLKHLRWSLFLRNLQACNLIKKDSNRCFSVKFRKFLRTTFFTEHLWWLYLEGICEGTSLVKFLQSQMLQKDAH